MSTVNNQVTADERAGTSSAIGNIPDVHANTSIKQTVTITGTGQGNISIVDIRNALGDQNDFFLAGNVGNLYIHEIRAYGVTGGYLSLTPYPHRQNVTVTDAGSSFFFNHGTNNFGTGDTGILTQMYDFGVAGASRPHLKWTYPKNEIINNPLYFNVFRASNGSNSQIVDITSQTIACTVQSVNAGDALYIVQFDITVQPNVFIPLTTAFNASAIDPDAMIQDNYKGPKDTNKRIAEAEKAMATANKKRKIKHTKDMTMPSRDV